MRKRLDYGQIAARGSLYQLVWSQRALGGIGWLAWDQKRVGFLGVGLLMLYD